AEHEFPGNKYRETTGGPKTGRLSGLPRASETGGQPGFWLQAQTSTPARAYPQCAGAARPSACVRQLSSQALLPERILSLTAARSPLKRASLAVSSRYSSKQPHDRDPDRRTSARCDIALTPCSKAIGSPFDGLPGNRMSRSLLQDWSRASRSERISTAF